MTVKQGFPVFTFYLSFFLLSSAALWPQDFSAVGRDLDQLESLIADTQRSMEEQQKLLNDLQENLNESGNLIGNYGNIISEQERLLADLQEQLNKMSETYRRQSALSAKYEKSSKFWRIFTLIAVPTAAALSGGIVWAVSR